MHSSNIYPQGIECVWIASDINGHVGAFITAGIGPVPVSALHSDQAIEELEDRLCMLPQISKAILVTSAKRPDDFINLAERGFFVYDWSDVHRTQGAALNAYEPIAIPANPISATSLNDHGLGSLLATRFDNVIFSGDQTLNVNNYVECLTGL
jgi:hypothetical protein